MSDFFKQDFGSIPEDHATSGDLPPLIQWRRGDRQGDDERLANGCFELPVERYAVPNLEPVDVIHRNVAKPAYLFKGLHLSVLAWRKDWFTGTGDNRRVVTSYDPSVKAWSRIQAWVLVKQLEGELFMVTFSGSNSIGFQDTINTFRQEIIVPAQVKAERKFPLYAFWMPVGPGEVKEFKQHGTYATPPALFLHTPIQNDDIFEKLYIGPELIEKAIGLYDAAQEWAGAKFGGQDDEEDAKYEEQQNGYTVPANLPPPATVGQTEQPVQNIHDEIPF